MTGWWLHNFRSFGEADDAGVCEAPLRAPVNLRSVRVTNGAKAR
jgi:hypothetical protein